MKAMTVSELIEKLQDFPDTAEVCFCDGDEHFAIVEDRIELKYTPIDESVDSDTLIDAPKDGYEALVIL